MSITLESVSTMVRGWMCSTCCEPAPGLPSQTAERDALMKLEEQGMLLHDQTADSLTSPASCTSTASLTQPPHHQVADRHAKRRRGSITAGSASSAGQDTDGEQHLYVMRHGHRQDEEQRSWHQFAEHPWNPPLSALGRKQVSSDFHVLCRCLALLSWPEQPHICHVSKAALRQDVMIPPSSPVSPRQCPESLNISSQVCLPAFLRAWLPACHFACLIALLCFLSHPAPPVHSRKGSQLCTHQIVGQQLTHLPQSSPSRAVTVSENRTCGSGRYGGSETCSLTTLPSDPPVTNVSPPPPPPGPLLLSG